ncbi:MAG: Transcriptional regulator TetR [Planctomycetaceae bacterium]|nr:Transcriptional regulator TetR [Planctomycetaceae bacterium]
MDALQEQTRDRLLEAAGEIFAEYGFQAATVRDICRRGKANVAAVNYYFGDKQALYIAAVERAHCSAAGLINVVWPKGWTPQQKLSVFVRQWLEQQLAENLPSWHMRLMLREMSDPTDACVKLVEAYIRPMAETLRGVIRELTREDLAERQGRMIGFSIVSQCLFYKVHRPIAELLVGREEYTHFNLPAIAEHITRFSLAALGQGPPVTATTSNLEPMS